MDDRPWGLEPEQYADSPRSSFFTVDPAEQLEQIRSEVAYYIDSYRLLSPQGRRRKSRSRRS